MKKMLMINISALTAAIVVTCGSTIYTAKEIDLSYSMDENTPQILEQDDFQIAGQNDFETTPLVKFELDVVSLNNFNNIEDIKISEETLLEMQLLSSNNSVTTFSIDTEKEAEIEEVEPEIEEVEPEIEEVEPEIEEVEPEIEEVEPEIEEVEPEIEEVEPEIEEVEPEIEEVEPEIDDTPTENIEPDFTLPQIDVEVRVEEEVEDQFVNQFESNDEDDEDELQEEDDLEDVTDNNDVSTDNSNNSDSSKPSYAITTTDEEWAWLLDTVAGAVQREIVGTNTAPNPSYYEAYKAQAVASRSYMEYYKTTSGKYPSMTYLTPHAKTIELTEMVLKEIMYYDGKPINATYHASAGGSTQSAVYVWGTNVPYLRAVESKYDSSPYTATMSVSDVKSKLSAKNINVSGDPSTWFDLAGSTKTDGDFIDDIKICGQFVSARSLRESILGYSVLRSPKITNISVSGDTFTFTTLGYGHGVGLSQNGALGYAKNEGYSYKDILNHYYTGITIY